MFSLFSFGLPPSLLLPIHLSQRALPPCWSALPFALCPPAVLLDNPCPKLPRYVCLGFPRLDWPNDLNGPRIALECLQSPLLTNLQRASSSSAGSESASSPFYLTASATAATAAAIGSAAWYYHLYGQEAFAATPAEEG